MSEDPPSAASSATSEFKYDVAFSFLSEDEPLATRLNDLLGGRVSTFLYSDRQEEIAGTDGMETFARVFAIEARVAVVLYRCGWGDRGFTMVERDAIRNRAYQQGWDFVFVIPMDDPAAPPPWLPRSQLWFGLQRWGIEAACAAIEERVRQAGGEPKEQTFEDVAARKRREIEFNERRQQFRNSPTGVAWAESEIRRLLEIVQEKVSNTQGLGLRTGFKGSGLFVAVNRTWLWIHWRQSYGNTLDESELELDILRLGRPPGSKDVRVRRETFEVDLGPDGSPGWRHPPDGRVHATPAVADYALRMIVELVDLGAR